MKKVKNRQFDPDWWFTSELSEDDPWTYIVADFHHGQNIVRKLSKEGFERGHVVIGGMPESRSKKESIEFAFSLAANILEDLIEKISRKNTDLEFVWLWGEFQKAIVFLEAARPEFKRMRGLKAHTLRSKKDDARQWFALWFDWFKNRSIKERKSRKAFESLFINWMQEIRVGKRKMPQSTNQQSVLDLINKIAANPFDKDAFRTAESFSYRKLYGGDLQRLSSEAKRNNALPPVGEENYPLIRK